MFSTHLSCSARHKAFAVREKSLAQKRHWAQKVFAYSGLRHRCIYTEKTFRNTLYYKACTKYFPVLLCTTKLAQSTSQYYLKHFPVLLCTTKLAQGTSQYYFALQSLQKEFPSTTLLYKACTKQVPLLLCTTKLAQTTSQYYFVLQSLHKLLPSITEVTTVYRKACTHYFPVVLCRTSLQKVLPSTTLYYKACTKHVPVLLCSTKLAQSTSQYYFVLQSLQTTSQYYFVLQSLHKLLPSIAEVTTVCTAKLAHTTSQ